MDQPASRLSIAYVHYGEQSGVTERIAAALAERGHDLRLLSATGGLEPRDPETHRRRVTPRVALHLAIAAARFGRQTLVHRWNTPYAFDRHTDCAGRALAALDPAPDLVLQNGALFSPGFQPRAPYALLVDNTSALAQAAPACPESGLLAAPDFGDAWRARERAVYRGASAIGAFSRHAADSLVRQYGVDPARVHVVGAGATVFPAEAPRRDDGRTILFIGRDFARKGGHVLLDAFARLRQTAPKARLLLVGPVRPPLPLPEGAFHLGPLPREELPALLSQSTVFAMPSLREPFGLALLDAMACGVACVGARQAAMPEIVAEGETGLLVPPGDAVSLALALAKLLRDPERTRAMGARGRARVKAGFLWSHTAERLERALRTSAGPARGRGRAA